MASKTRILVIEKYFEVAEIIKNILELEGYEVDFAFTSSDVELKIEFADAVVCDSYGIFEKPDYIIKVCEFRSIPCILTSSEPIESVSVPVLEKPFGSAELIGAIKSLQL